MSKACSNYSRGLTLIEVIASLALLTTLLVGIIFAQDRHARQIRTARQRIGVVEQVDQLLYQWLKIDRAIPREATGPLPGSDDYIWETRLWPDGANRGLEIEVVRLEIRPRRDVLGERPVLTLDLAVPAAPSAVKEK